MASSLFSDSEGGENNNDDDDSSNDSSSSGSSSNQHTSVQNLVGADNPGCVSSNSEAADDRDGDGDDSGHKHADDVVDVGSMFLDS